MRFLAILTVAAGCAAVSASPCHQFSDKIESPCNDVVKETCRYEIREYADNQFFTNAYVNSTCFLRATTEGFNKNFAYISGKNARNESIPMTAPVIFRRRPCAQSPVFNEADFNEADFAATFEEDGSIGSDSSGDVAADCGSDDGGNGGTNEGNGWHVGFYVPKSKYATRGDIPTPNDDAVTIEQLPTNITYAVKTFGGFASPRDFARAARSLYRSLRYDNVTVVTDGPPLWRMVWASYDSPFVLFHRHNEVWLRVDGGDGDSGSSNSDSGGGSGIIAQE